MRRFTELYIRNLQPQAKRYEVREPGGLGLWTYPSGRKSWVFTYRFLGKKYRIILGEYPAKSLKRARTELNDQRKLLADGANPKDARDAERVAAIRAREAEEQELSLKRLAELYLGLWAKPRKRTWRKDQLMLEKDVIPRWGRRKVKTITLRDVVALLDDIQARGAPIQANRMLALLKKMFNFSIGRGYMTTNPCKGITMPAQETPGQRVLTTDEIKTFWTRLETAGMEDDLKRILKLVLILGQRPGEICGAQWEQISGDLWTIPGERHKSKRAHAVPLPTLALSILGTRKEKGPVFASRRKDGRVNHIREDSLAGALKRNLGYFGVQDFTAHDLRRTASTHWSDVGVSQLLKPLLLGHVKTDVTGKHYDLYDYLPEKRAALDKWSRYLTRLVEGGAEEVKVVPFPKTQ